MKIQFNSLSIFRYFSVVLLFCLVFSCKKSTNHDSELEEGEVVVTLDLSLDGYENGGELLNADSPAAKSSRSSAEPMVSTISLNKDFYLEAVIAPSVGTENKSGIDKRNKADNKAATSDLDSRAWYRLIAYPSIGSKAKKIDTLIQIDGSKPKLKLDGGVIYNFVAYSVNSTTKTELPTVLPSPVNSYANGYVVADNTADFLFYQDNVQITGDKQQKIDIKLRHQFNQITVVFDASKTGYPINALTADLKLPTRTVDFYFRNENKVYAGSNRTAKVDFSNNKSDNSKWTSTPQIVGIEEMGNILVFNSIEIGGQTFDNIPANGLVPVLKKTTLEPGKSYTITLTIVPEDKMYTDDKNNLVAQIAGQTWLRLNVGATGSKPDDVDDKLWGNYYQFGRKEYTSTGTKIATESPLGWYDNPNKTDDRSWSWSYTSNLGSTIVKNEENDPCPDGFRVPTEEEYLKLLDNTNFTISGDHTILYKRAGTFASKRNASVKLTFPAQGWYNVAAVIDNNTKATTYKFAKLDQNGEVGFYWTSTRTSAENTISFRVNSIPTTKPPGGDATDASPLISLPVKCISTNNK